MYTNRQRRIHEQYEAEHGGQGEQLDIAELERRLANSNRGDDENITRAGSSPDDLEPWDERAISDLGGDVSDYHLKGEDGGLTVEQAVEQRREKRAASAQQQRDDEAQRAREEETNYHAELRAAVSMHTPQEQAALVQLQQTKTKFEKDRATLNARLPQCTDEVRKLAAEGRMMEAQALQQEIQGAIARHDQMRNNIAATEQALQQHQGQKHRAALETIVFKNAPGLKDPRVREQFVDWVQRETGHSREAILTTRDPEQILPYWRRFQGAVKDARASKARKEIASTARITRGVGSEADSKSARRALRETGSEDAFLRLMETRRLERQRGLR